MTQITPEQRTDRLTQLRRVVAAAPEELLHMRAVVEKADCGTARCALGWAIIDPWFQQNTEINELVPVDWRQFYLPRQPAQGVLGDMFGITDDEAEKLFALKINYTTGAHAVSRREVLQRIDSLIAGKPIKHYAVVAAQLRDSFG